MINHILVITRRKRINKGGLQVNGESRTLCGGERTSRDISRADALREIKDGNLQKWVRCTECRKMCGGR